MASPRALVLLLSTAILALLALAGAYLFREKTLTIPGIGRAKLQWRWGNAALIEIDSNQDGLVDFRAEFHRRATNFSTDEPFGEAWDSSKCNGRLDRHLIAGPDGVLKRLEVDTNGDGHFDLELSGSKARDYLSKHPRAKPCRWGKSAPTSRPGWASVVGRS